QAVMLATLGRLWLEGATVGWPALRADERRRRLPLPTYPFERQRYWVEPSSITDSRPEAGPRHSSDALAPDSLPRSSTHPRPILQTAFVKPSTDAEKVVTQIWEELLGSSPIGVNDNFFELGGNSLMAIRLVSRLHDAFPLEIALRQVFEATTVARLSSL